MQLGQLKWAAAQRFYDGPTLTNGDQIEREAESNHQISSHFPNYVKFWKLHICPECSVARQQGKSFVKPDAMSEVGNLEKMHKKWRGISINLVFSDFYLVFSEYT
jgi:hypothetical protein